jgi:hypothetical protein
MQGSVLKQCWNYRPSGAENRHMRDRENLDKSMSFDQKGASTYSLQLRRYRRTKWLTLTSRYIHGAFVPAPHLGFVQSKVHNFFQLSKRLGG